jgi:probable F420-dependent oxidoreductase
VVGAREAHQLSSARRLGISIPAETFPMSEIPAVAARAEALGYTDCWSFEVNVFDAFTPLAAAAATTRGLRLGTAIAPVFFRPPGLLAMQAAAMADLAPGRFVLGVGSSTPVVVQQWMGIPFTAPVTAVRETVVAVRALLAGEKVGGMRLGRPPAQPVPIWMAALGERMAAAAQELADGLCLFMVGPGLVREIVGDKDSMCRITVIPGQDEAARALARRLVTTYALVPFYARVMARQGFAEEVGAINERWAAGDRAAAPGQVSDAMLRELVLTGSLDDIAAGLDRYRKAGLGCPVLAITSDFSRVFEALAPGG